MALNFIDDINTLYVNRVFLKENVGSGTGPNVDGPSEGKAEDYEAPHRDCLCTGDSDECSCEHEEDEMVFAPTNKTKEGEYPEDSEHEDHETNAYMAKQQLYRTVKMASMLHDIIKDEEELEPWMAAKITQAFDDLNAIFGYKDYQHFRDQIDHDMEIEEKTEHDLYKSIDQGGESLINKIKEMMRGQSKDKVETAVYGMIKMLEA
jgi:hypothetical protein